MSKAKALVDDEMKATGSANSMVHDMAQDHRGVVAKFGRYSRSPLPSGRVFTL